VKRNWIWLLLFGGLWGLSEVIFGKALSDANAQFRQIWLCGAAVFILSFSRTMNTMLGASVVIGAIASLLRALNASPFYCHIIGIFLLAVAYEFTASLLLKNKRISSVRACLAGLLGVFIGNIAFALGAIFILEQPYWVSQGWTKVFDHIFLMGGLSALAAGFTAILGYKAGCSLNDLHFCKSKTWLKVALAGAVTIFTLTIFVF